MIFVLLGGMVGISFAASEATKESHVGEGGVMAALDGEVVKTAESTVALPLYVAPILPVGERESLSVMTISYRDASVHGLMVEAGLIGENDTAVEYPHIGEGACYAVVDGSWAPVVTRRGGHALADSAKLREHALQHVKPWRQGLGKLRKFGAGGRFREAQ